MYYLSSSFQRVQLFLLELILFCLVTYSLVSIKLDYMEYRCVMPLRPVIALPAQ